MYYFKIITLCLFVQSSGIVSMENNKNQRNELNWQDTDLRQAIQEEEKLKNSLSIRQTTSKKSRNKPSRRINNNLSNNNIPMENNQNIDQAEDGDDSSINKKLLDWYVKERREQGKLNQSDVLNLILDKENNYTIDDVDKIIADKRGQPSQEEIINRIIEKDIRKQKARKEQQDTINKRIDEYEKDKITMKKQKEKKAEREKKAAIKDAAIKKREYQKEKERKKAAFSERIKSLQKNQANEREYITDEEYAARSRPLKKRRHNNDNENK